MSLCLSWEYLLKKLGIRRKTTRSKIADARAEEEPRRQDSPDKSPNPLQVKQRHENNKYSVSLLHTEWRRYPHVPIYGWTNDHEQQLRNLANMIVNGNLVSAYYDSEAEYRAARFLNDFRILPGPNVNDVNEAVLLLQRNKGFQYNSYCNEGMLEYDADDESENNSRSLRRYYNHHKPKRHVGQRTMV